MTVRTVVKAQDTIYEEPEATEFIVFGQYHNYCVTHNSCTIHVLIALQLHSWYCR